MLVELSLNATRQLFLLQNYDNYLVSVFTVIILDVDSSSALLSFAVARAARPLARSACASTCSFCYLHHRPAWQQALGFRNLQVVGEADGRLERSHHGAHLGGIRVADDGAHLVPLPAGGGAGRRQLRPQHEHAGVLSLFRPALARRSPYVLMYVVIRGT